ncbi:MAG: glycoside hydrolase family 3 N-terminal domain-containing protein [Bacteroidota bacterium]
MLLQKSKPRTLLGLSLLFFLFNLSPVVAQYHANLNQSHAQEAIWVDSVYNALSQDERIGQLFMIRAHSDLGPEHVASVRRNIERYHVGGLCFFQGTPTKQVELLNSYQAQSRIPMMIAIDGEWGLQMRMKKTVIPYPRQLMLGAIRNNRLLYDFGAEVAKQMKRVGVNVNFAPVADVNNNPANPVIGTRSFGEDRINVALKSIQYAKGMQDHGVVACAKHFPGHGDTNADSHYSLPLIPHDRQRLDSIEMYPFRALVEQGVGSVMVGHLQIPAIEARENHPTSLSAKAINGILREEMGFEGLTFTDGLGMKGVTNHFGNGEAEAEALLAGNDILLLPVNLGQAKAAIEKRLINGELSETALRKKVKRVLRAKYRMGLTRYTAITTENILEDINNAEAKVLRERLVENALTLVRQEDIIVPIKTLKGVKIGALAVGITGQAAFQARLRDYAPVDWMNCQHSLSTSEQRELLRKLGEKDIVIVSLHKMNNLSSKDFGIQPSLVQLLEELQTKTKVILTVFGNPYSLRLFDDVETVLQAYNDDELTQHKAAEALFGALGINGRLPVTASERSHYNSGVSTRTIFRMGYTEPERVGMNGDSLRAHIDALAKAAIDAGATPGCVVLVARYGKVVFHEAYGHHTYSRRQPVRENDIYDLASITKIMATTLAIMDLVQEGRLSLDAHLGDYLPELRGTNKNNLSIREILAHRAALKPWIPFYASTLEANGSRKREVYRSRAGGAYRVKVNDNLFLNETYIDSIWYHIDQSDLRSNNNYRYSDLGFYYLSRVVERVSGQRLDDYLAAEFYRSLGLYNTVFNPRERFPLNRIPPTERDNYWRQQKVHGYVHDMGAAMLGGVSGHAGLFGNARELAILGQLLLQRGVYGNLAYLRPDIVREFTRRFPNETRRGLGFDMKQLNPDRSQNVAAAASPRTFGHLGFTGTCVWADPQEELLYVFLSNRTYPSMRNNKLGRMNIRPKMQAAAYRAITRPAAQPATKPIETRKLPEAIGRTTETEK